MCFENLECESLNGIFQGIVGSFISAPSVSHEFDSLSGDHEQAKVGKYEEDVYMRLNYTEALE